MNKFHKESHLLTQSMHKTENIPLEYNSVDNWGFTKILEQKVHFLYSDSCMNMYQTIEKY